MSNPDILETQMRSLEITELTALYQLLGNADEVLRFINELEVSTGKKEEAKVMLERMIKSPLRRQVGRLKLIRLSILQSTTQPEKRD